MIEERFRLMYLSKNGTGIKQISFTGTRFCLFTFFLLIILVTMTTFSIGVFTRLYHNYRIIYLENDKKLLQRELLTIKERVSFLSSQLAQVETTGDELRNVANLPPIDNDTRQVGIGGPSYSASLDFGYYPDEIGTAVEIKLDLDKLEREVQLEKSSMAEIAARFQERQDQYDHWPSIRPILGGRITSHFGYRIDPFTKKPANHEGVDIYMPRGTRVLATADGRVILAKTLYTPHKNYGMEVVIDHGYGYKTRYAHLSKILVRRGQIVKKGEIVGEVGSTGRAKGPHLHYEVMENNKRRDPEFFIYN